MNDADAVTDLLTAAACECLSPDQMDQFEALFADADTRARFTRCVLKRAPASAQADAVLSSKPAAPARAEPVAYFINDSAPGMKTHYSQIDEQFKNDKDVFALYAAPLPASTVGRVEVSDEQIEAVWDSTALRDDRVLAFGRAIADELGAGQLRSAGFLFMSDDAHGPFYAERKPGRYLNEWEIFECAPSDGHVCERTGGYGVCYKCEALAVQSTAGGERAI